MKIAEDNGTDPKESPARSADPAETQGAAKWLYVLNSFLERAFREADRDTGC